MKHILVAVEGNAKSPRLNTNDLMKPLIRKHNDLARWSGQVLDFSSGIAIVKMNILPRLLYLFQSLHISVPQSQFMEWDKWISRFIFGGKRPWIRLATVA